MKLIFHVDCTKEVNNDKYFEIGETRIVDSKIGSYREAGENAQSRFGYRFKIEDITKPHLLEVVYPDDRRRTICVNDGITYDLNTGVVCGNRNEPSNSMKTIKSYFWPRWEDSSVVFSSWGKGEPAAISEFSVYELDSLEDFGMKSEVGFREFGIQYEDITNVGSTEGTQDFYSWSDHVVDFLRFSGQNKLIIPINWYHGPCIPVKSQKFGTVNIYIAPDKKQYFRSTTSNLTDWLDRLLTKMDEANLSFTGSLTLLRIPGLMANMNNDLESIKKGAETYNNIMCNGTVQSSANDWTTQYSSEYYVTISDALKKTGKLPEFAYGEKDTSGRPGPIFNPLHPTVRSQVKEYLLEVCENYKHHPSFKGLAINFWHATMLWYATLNAGYDDYSISLFEKETGISTGTDISDPDRFEKRYKFLMRYAREAFIDWRCKKIREFILEIRDGFKAIREDLTLTITVWNETSAWRYFDDIDEDAQFGARGSNYDVYKLGGLDMALFKDDDGIEFSVEMNHHRDATGWEVDGIDLPLERSQMFTDHAFLDEKTRDVLKSNKAPTSFIFNCWSEAWGNYALAPCDDNDPNLEAIYNLPDYKADSVVMQNSEYDDDPPESRKFFFDSQLRITALFPAEPYFGEWYANELAAQDSLSITAGGLYLDKSHVDLQRKFASEYCILPRCKFNTLKGTSDPVTVRWLQKDGKTYIYAVNREPYDIPVSIKTADGKEIAAKTLEAFELKTWIFDECITPDSYSVDISKETIEKYELCCNETLAIVEAALAKGITVPAAEELVESIKTALGEKRFAFVRHALSSYPIKKVLSLA